MREPAIAERFAFLREARKHLRGQFLKVETARFTRGDRRFRVTGQRQVCLGLVVDVTFTPANEEVNDVRIVLVLGTGSVCSFYAGFDHIEKLIREGEVLDTIALQDWRLLR